MPGGGGLDGPSCRTRRSGLGRRHEPTSRRAWTSREDDATQRERDTTGGEATEHGATRTERDEETARADDPSSQRSSSRDSKFMLHTNEQSKRAIKKMVGQGEGPVGPPRSSYCYTITNGYQHSATTTTMGYADKLTPLSPQRHAHTS